MTGVDFTDVALRLIGAFYAFAGVVATRGGLMSRLLDTAIAAIGGDKPNAAETVRALWMVSAGIVILAGGVALMLRIELAAWLFVLSALLQGLYLSVVAPHYLDPSDPPDATGRRQTTNAFILYLAATAFVLWAQATGRFHDWRTVPTPLLILAIAAVAGYGAYALGSFFRSLSK